MADAPGKPVYLLTGSDRPKIETALSRLRAHFVPEAIDTVSALDTSGKAVVAHCATRKPLRRRSACHRRGCRRAARRGQASQEGWRAGDIGEITSYLASPAPEIKVLALVGEDVRRRRSGKRARSRVTSSSTAWRRGRSRAGSQRSFSSGASRPSRKACALLVQLVGAEDLHGLAAEIDKLSTWAGGEPIGEREVELLSAAVADVPIFKLTDAWAGRDAARTLEASETIFERESKTRRDTAARLAGALGSHLQRLGSIKRVAAEDFGRRRRPSGSG